MFFEKSHKNRTFTFYKDSANREQSDLASLSFLTFGKPNKFGLLLLSASVIRIAGMQPVQVEIYCYKNSKNGFGYVS